MDILTLIERARTSGLTLAVRDGRLTIQGPKSVAPLARALGERKAEVIAALSAPIPKDARDPPPPAPPAVRPAWVIRPGGKVVPVADGASLPPDALWRCREGDDAWMPVRVDEGRPNHAHPLGSLNSSSSRAGSELGRGGLLFS